MDVNFKEILAENGLPTTEETIVEKFEELTEEEGFITNTSNVSPFWRLVKAIAVQPFVWLVDKLSSEVMPNLFVKTAKGYFLDLQANAVGVERKAATKAEGVVNFYKRDPQMSIVIKAGTVVQTERINDVIYKLIVKTETLIPKGIQSAPVPVIAEKTGADYNLSSGYYRILPVAIAGIERVENGRDWLITPAGDEETDDELRERYRVHFSSVGSHHIDSVYKGMIAEIAGLTVDRIYFKHDAPRGPGTANVYLLLDTGTTSQPFIDKVNNHIQQGYHGHGDDLQCFQMPETLHTIQARIYFLKNIGLTDAHTEKVLNEINAIIRCAFRENNSFKVTKTYPFSRFSFSKLSEEIHERFSEIASIEWLQNDIVSELSIPRIQRLNILKGN